MNSVEKLYSTISDGFSMIRSGANRLITEHEKCWNVEGQLVDRENPGEISILCPAYSIHELLNIKLPNQFDSPITGNSRNDITMAIHKIVSEMMKINKFPFRIWSFGSYVRCGIGNQHQIVIDESGRIRHLKLLPNGLLMNDPQNSSSYEIECFTGFFDKHHSLILDNDAVLIGNELHKTVFRNGWVVEKIINIDNGKHLEGITRNLSEINLSCEVVGSSRFNLDFLIKIGKMIRKQNS